MNVPMEPVRPPQNTAARIADKVLGILGFFFLVLEMFLAFSMVLRLLGANPNNGLARLVYDLTGVFIAPFATLFSTHPYERPAALVLATMIAMLAYALLAWILAEIITLIGGHD